MKKIAFTLALIMVLTSAFWGCDISSKPSTTAQVSENLEGTTENTDNHTEKLNEKFSSSPFADVDGGSKKLTDEEIKLVLSNVPCDRYEIYPGLHNVPVSATLYKNDEVISIDVNDPSIIRLVNLYNNSVYYHKYSYTQGLLNIDYIEEVVNNYRLEIIYTPYYTQEGSYDINIALCDTIVVTNKRFVLIAHDIPGYENQLDRYPFSAVGHQPLYNNYAWLDLLGF